MASYQWIKLYDEILDDPKMGRLSDGAYRFCINLFLLASRHPARDGSLPELCDIAWTLRLNEQTALSHLEELAKAGIVVSDDAGIFVSKFAARQSAVDVSERMKQYRDRKRKNVTPDVTPENNNGYELVTKRNTDIDKKKKRREETPAPVWNMITAISSICAQTYSQSSNHQEFEDAAYGLIGADITASDVEQFGQWWARGNGFHKDKPFVKNILSQIKSAKDNGWKDISRANGKAPDNTTWQRIITAVTNGVFTGLSSEEKTALRSIGGIPIIKAMTPYDEPKLKSQFFQALGATA